MSIERVVERLRDKNIHVVGIAGTEGAAVVDFLVRRGITTITAHDMRRADEFAAEFARTHEWLPPPERGPAGQRFLTHPITYCWADRYLAGTEQADIIFVPQAWFRHERNAPLRRLRQRGVPFSSMTHLFFETAPGPIIGVTGTNGKFTVASLIHHMLQRAGWRAFFSGNDRSHTPMLYYVDALTPSDWLVLELSNRQLIDLPYSPRIAVITNIAPHHLDDHGTMEAYVEVKRNIVRHQRPDDQAVLNADDVHTAAIAATCPRPHLFSRLRPVTPGAFVRDASIVIVRGRQEQMVPLAVLRQPGAHAVENTLAACLAAALAGVPVAAMAEALADFTGLPHRLQFVGEVGGVRYYEDSLATNPTAAAAGIASMDRPFVLIAGGARPGATPEAFAPMRAALASTPVLAVLLIGATAPIMAQAFAGLPVSRLETLERAVAEAVRRAGPGEAVLLSPGCESFDQFRDYRERGERFTALVQMVRPTTR